MTEMKGPVLDNNPPVGHKWEETTIKWSFSNKTEEKICDLRVTVHGRWYSILPDIREVTVKDANGNVVGNASYNDEHDIHIQLETCIEKDANFTVTIRFDSSFDLGESIQFAPTDSAHHHLVATATQTDPQYLAYVTTTVPEPVSDVLTLGGVLPIPWTTPLTMVNIIRWLARLGAAAGAAGMMAPLGPNLPTPSPYFRRDLKMLAYKVLSEDLGREPSKGEMRALVLYAHAGGVPIQAKAKTKR